MLVIRGAGMLKLMLELLRTPPSVTRIEPPEAVAGRVATIAVSDQLTKLTGRLLTVIVLLPCVAPKPAPLIWIWELTGPLEGDTERTTGFGIVNKTSWVLGTELLTQTCTGPA